MNKFKLFSLFIARSMVDFTESNLAGKISIQPLMDCREVLQCSHYEASHQSPLTSPYVYSVPPAPAAFAPSEYQYYPIIL